MSNIQESSSINLQQNQAKSLLATEVRENSSLEQELFELRQTFEHQLKWRKIFKRKIAKLRRKLKLKRKEQNKLEIQQDDLEQEYRRLRKALKKQKLEIVLEIVQHLKYLKSMAKVIRPAQKFYLQERKAYRKRLLKMQKRQENALKELKAKFQSLQKQLNEINAQIENYGKKIVYYKRKRNQMNPDSIRDIIQQKAEEAEKNLRMEYDMAKIVYEKDPGANIVGFQTKQSEQEVSTMKKLTREGERLLKVTYLMPLEERQSEKQLSKSKKKSKPKSFLHSKLAGLTASKMELYLTASSTALRKRSKKGFKKANKYKANKSEVGLSAAERIEVKTKIGNIKPISKKFSKRQRRSGSHVFFVSRDATVVAPMAGIIESLVTKPIDKTTMQTITVPTKSQGFRSRNLKKTTTSSSSDEETADTEFNEAEVEDEERTSLSAFISLYNVKDNKLAMPAKATHLDRLPKIRAEKRPSLSFGEQFFKNLVKSQRQSIRQTVILERQQQKQLERERAERAERERRAADEVLTKRLSDPPENKLDVLVRRALQSTFRHADVIRKDLPVVDEHILKTFKRKPFGSNLLAFISAQKSDFDFRDDTETVEQEIAGRSFQRHEDEFEFQSVEEETAPRLTVEELIKRYFAQLKDDKKQAHKKKKKIKKLKKRKNKKLQVSVACEQKDEPRLVCSCCGMTILQIGGPCSSLDS